MTSYLLNRNSNCDLGKVNEQKTIALRSATLALIILKARRILMHRAPKKKDYGNKNIIKYS